MVQRVKVLATEPEDPGLIPGSHMVEAENQLTGSPLTSSTGLRHTRRRTQNA